MEYSKLLDLSTELAYQLAMAGAETFRIEESTIRILKAYDIEAEVFSIPNCLHISIEPVVGRPLTRMRRIGNHGNNLDAVERFTNLSRRICTERPAPEVAEKWLKDAISKQKQYGAFLNTVGCFFGPFGFSFLFGGTVLDAIFSGFCGIWVGLMNRFMDKLGVNQFFQTIAAAFLMALPAYGIGTLHLTNNPDAVITGALMLLVPGLLFTNAMRDIIYGDTNSGINRIVQVFLIAVAIALGTATAYELSELFWGMPPETPNAVYSIWFQCLACFIGCMGFSILFNIHGPGGLLCGLGGVLTWLVYLLVLQFGGSSLGAYFWGTLFAAGYSEIMARIRKYPAISYLVVSIFPLIPGAGAYFTMNHAVKGDMDAFAQQGMQTVAIAGIMAVAILLISTVARILTTWRKRK